MATATHTRLELPVLPEKKSKNYLARVVDAIGTLKLAKESITKQYDEARDILVASEESTLRGERFEITLSRVDSMRLDTELVAQYLKSQGKNIEEFQKTSTSVRLNVKPIA